MRPISLTKALDVVPGGSSTSAKSPLRLYPPATPTFAISADGCRFTDDLGRVWLDCDMGLGAIIWGHRRAEIDSAVRQQLDRGVLFSVPATLEIEVAERIIDRLAVFDSLRFCKSGSEAVSSAVRVARSASGRSVVVCGSYHGWHDWAAYHFYRSASGLGIPREVAATVRWVDEESYAAFLPHLTNDPPPSSVIVCPEHWSIPDLCQLRAQCSQRGIFLVFDEVKSGLRFGKRGVFAAAGVVPDLICLSKGLANGLPLAALAGPRELMQSCIAAHITGTYAGECLSLAAASAAEQLLCESAGWPPWETASLAVMERANRTITECGLQRTLVVNGYPGCFRVGTPGLAVSVDPFREHFVRQLAGEGIFSAGYILPSAAHQPDDFSAIEQAVIEAIRSWASLNS
jgi:glutamate-1-semialdehyde 2,1-aminomutase